MQSHQKSRLTISKGEGRYFEDFTRTLYKEFSDCGTGISEMTVIDLKTFKIPFAEIIDSCTVHGFADFVCILKKECAEFSSNSSTDRRMQKPILQSCRPEISFILFVNT